MGYKDPIDLSHLKPDPGSLVSHFKTPIYFTLLLYTFYLKIGYRLWVPLVDIKYQNVRIFLS